MLYAVTDIETTGSNAEGNEIIEIGIVISDGISIIEKYETLINPQRPIDFYVQKLTGIKPAMLVSQPLWADVAEKVFNLLDGKIFVAHNVMFDYSFLQYHLKKQGYQWLAPKLDTIKLTRQYFKGIHKYGLSTLIDHFNIEVPSRHRAFGDAVACHYLLQRAIEKGGQEAIQLQATKHFKHHNLSPYIDSVTFEMLPEKPGVYYFLNDRRKIIYVGKAKDIKKRILSHFYSDVNKEKKQLLLKKVHYLDYKVCLNELHANLYESSEIKLLWPKWNKAQKFGESNYGLYLIPTIGGLQRIVIEKIKKTLIPIITHPNKRVLESWLHQAAALSEACFCLTGSGKEKKCDKTKCSFAITEMDFEEKDLRIQKVIKMVHNQPSFIIYHFKKNVGHLYIYVKKGSLVGWTFGDKYMNPVNINQIVNHVEPVKENAYIRRLITKHVNEEPKSIHWITDKKIK
jgi:DNA polymerase III subunit epsilon